MMPTSTEILQDLTSIANAWRGLAIAWHVPLGALLVGLLAGWRPPARVAGALLAAPLVSVAAIACVSGHWFDGAYFSAIALMLATTAVRLPAAPVVLAPWPLRAAGLVLVAFGATYPHFLTAPSWVAHLYAAPFGLLPGPTLSALVGLAVLLNLLGSRSWSTVLSAAALAYGVIGALRLGIALDFILLAGAVVALFAAALSTAAPPSARRRPHLTPAFERRAA